jgi:transposase
MDMGPAYAKSVRADGHAPRATICYDPFHAVKIVTDALDVERRKAWNELRAGGDAEAAKKFKGARWCLLKNPADLDPGQQAVLRKLKRRGGDVWRAYSLKEAFREIFSGDLSVEQAIELIDRWISRASRSRLPAFVKASKTIRKHRDGTAPGDQQRPGGGTELGRALDLQTGPRVPQPRSRPRPGHAHLRPDHPAATSRTTQDSRRLTHTHAGRARFPG